MFRSAALFFASILPATCMAFDSHVLDQNFGVGGLRTVSFDLGGERTDRAVAAFEQFNSNTIIVGQVDIAGGTRVGLTRLLPDGSLDSTFGTGGKLVVDLCMSRVNGATSLGGQFLVFGETIECSTDGSRDVRIAKFQANGSLDNSFGSNGVISRNFQPNADDRLYAVLHNPNNQRLWLLGSSTAQNETVERPHARLVSPDGLDTLTTLGTQLDQYPENARFVDGIRAASSSFFLIARDGTTNATSGVIQQLTDQLVLLTPVSFRESNTTTACADVSLRPVKLANIQGHIVAIGNRTAGVSELFYSSVQTSDITQGRRTECFSGAVMSVRNVGFDTAISPGKALVAGACTQFLPGGATVAMCATRLRTVDTTGPRLALDTTFNPDNGRPVLISFNAATGQLPASNSAAILDIGFGRTQIVGTRRWSGLDEDYAIAQLGMSPLLRNGFE